MPGDEAPQVSLKTTRLPSFKTPRDLRLSEYRELPNNALEGRTRKVFVPNFKIQRKKPEEKDGQDGNTEQTKSERGGSSPRSDRGKGRGRKSTNFVQNAGIFSEGFAQTLKSSSWKSKSSEPSTSMPKPKLRTNIKIDNEGEELVMKELLRDDFMEDPDLMPDSDYCPVQLPLQRCNLSVTDPTINIKKDEPLINGVKVKLEPGVEPVEEMNGLEEKPFSINDMRPMSFSDLVSRPSDRNFVFFQIPSCFPDFNDAKEEGHKNSLRALHEGRIGTLKIHKSGKTTAVINGVKLTVDPGTQASFRQDLVSVNLDSDTKAGNMVNIGKVTTRMLITPDWESLL